MSSTGKLPTSSVSQTIGAKAEQCFAGRRPENWRLDSLGGTADFGIDYQIQTLDGDQVADIFRVQLKGTTTPELSADGTFLSIQLKASTIRYYVRFTEPILLVLCDLSADAAAINCPLHYVWIHDELRRINVPCLPDTQDYVTLRIPKTNVLLSDTDLSPDIGQFRALAKIGDELDAALEKSMPALDSEARASLLQKVPAALAIRGMALFESLAADKPTVWPVRPPGSMAWYLSEADRHLNSGQAENAANVLADAAERLVSAASVEIAEYWHLTGRMHLLNMLPEDARRAFDHARAAEPGQPKYLAAWAETSLSIEFSIEGANDFNEVLSALSSSDPVILSVKARILAACKRYDEALEVLASFTGSEQLAAAAIIHTMRSQSSDAIAACESGLALEGVTESTRLLFLILKARAQFNLAVGMKPTDSADGTPMPLSGTPGMDIELLTTAWHGMGAAMAGLSLAGWPSNTAFVVDVLCATASILGKEEEALALLTVAAKKRPNVAALQAAVESVAVQTGAIETALQANALQPSTSAIMFRRISLLHMAKRDADCVSIFEANLPALDQAHPMFGETLALAIISADRLAKGRLAKSWLAIFETRTDLAERKACLDFFLATSRNKSNRVAALDALLGHFESLSRPLSIAVQLFHALNPISRTEAEKLVFAAEVLTKERLLPLDDIVRFGQALTTLERWAELLALVDDAQRRFETDKLLIAVKARALDRLGRTAEAMALLSPLIAAGTTESFILYTHIDIATRCGLLAEAIASTEALVSATKEPAKTIEPLRILHNLVRSANPTDPRVHDLAWRIGELTDQGNAIGEGQFLAMILTSSAEPDEVEGARIAEFRTRLQAYTTTFPDSPVLRSAKFAENASPDDILATIFELTGGSLEQAEARQAQVGENNRLVLMAPYAWRPKLMLDGVRDVPQLWEMAKDSMGEDPRLLLTMASSDWGALEFDQMRNRIPLMDLVSLLVAYDLGIVDAIFKLFKKIAVSQETFAELARLAAPWARCAASEKCRSIQTALQANFAKIEQPFLNESERVEANGLPKNSEEIAVLSKRAPYLLYSDDVFFRIFCSAGQSDFQSICTLDILSALEEKGFLTTAEAAEKIGNLCEWRVGLAIEHRWQLAVLPPSLNQASSVHDGISLILGTPPCAAMFTGIWSRPDAAYLDLQAHAAQVVSAMLGDAKSSPIAIAALISVWRAKTKAVANALQDDNTAFAFLARHALLNQATVGAEFSARLWQSLFLLKEHERGRKMDEASVLEVVSMVALVAAHSDLINDSVSRESFKSAFVKGLAGGYAELIFMQSYKKWRRDLAKDMKADAPPFSRLSNSMLGGTSYGQRWHGSYRSNLLPPPESASD